jgi:hypothetical protein
MPLTIHNFFVRDIYEVFTSKNSTSLPYSTQNKPTYQEHFEKHTILPNPTHTPPLPTMAKTAKIKKKRMQHPIPPRL